MIEALDFTFNGVSASEYDLQIYHIGDVGFVEEPVYNAEIIEERLNTRCSPLFYNLGRNKELTREITFGRDTYIDRDEVEEIVAWLTNVDSYKWLEFEQDELMDFKFKAIFTNVRVYYNGPYAICFMATIQFDSPYAYEVSNILTYHILNNKIVTSTGDRDTITIDNTSSLNDYYYPEVHITVPEDTTDIVIYNQTDDGRKFELHDIDNWHVDGDDALVIDVDNQNMIIKSNGTIQPYNYFGDANGMHYFFRLLQGKNIISFVASDATVTIVTQFPRRVAM